MVKAYGSKVIVELEKEDYVEHNGILMPSKDVMREFMKKQEKRYIGGDGYDNHFRDGIVTSIGPKCKYGLKEGDAVLLNRHNGVEFTHEEKKYISIEDIDISLIYRKE